MREKRRALPRTILVVWAALASVGSGCGSSGQNAGGSQAEGGAAGAGGALADAEGGAPGTVGALPASAVEVALENTRPAYESDEPVEYYRLDLRRDAAGVITLLRLSILESTLVPHPSLAADYVAVARDADRILSATPLIFPQQMKTTTIAEDGTRAELTTAVEYSDVAVFIANAADVASIDIVDSTGASALSLGADALSEAIVTEIEENANAPAPVQPGVLKQSLTTAQLALRYPHILYLEPGHEDIVDSALLRGGYIIPRTETMNDQIAEALKRLTPALLSSVATVGVVRLGEDSGSVYGLSLGSTLVINEVAFQDSQFVNTLIHEVTHCYTSLVDAVASEGDLSDWPDDVSTAAQATVSKYRLSVGLVEAWSNLHACCVEAGVASEYFGGSWEDFSDGLAFAAGFADNYGGVDPAEDIAMYVETTLLPTSSSQGICDRFKGLSKVIPAVGVPFAKLSLLNAVGAISDEDFRYCVGPAVSGDGVIGMDFPGTILFDVGLVAGHTEASGAPVFDVVGADGGSYTFMLEVALDSGGGSPLGMHRLDYVGIGNLGLPQLNGAYLANDDPLLARVSEQGFVLFSEASAEVTEGFVFGLVLQNAMGLNTDYLPFGTINVR